MQTRECALIISTQRSAKLVLGYTAPWLCVLCYNYVVRVRMRVHLLFKQNEPGLPPPLFLGEKKVLWQIKSGEWQNKIDCTRTNCPHTLYLISSSERQPAL